MKVRKRLKSPQSAPGSSVRRVPLHSLGQLHLAKAFWASGGAGAEGVRGRSHAGGALLLPGERSEPGGGCARALKAFKKEVLLQTFRDFSES